MTPRSASRATGIVITSGCSRRASRPMKADSPSSTALLIARATVFVARDPQLGYLVPPLAAEASAWFIEACSCHAGRLLGRVSRRWIRWLVWAVERLTVPGILLHWV